MFKLILNLTLEHLNLKTFAFECCALESNYIIGLINNLLINSHALFYIGG